MLTITVSKLQWYNYNKQTTLIKLLQANCVSTITIDKLLWCDNDKPCFYSFKGEGKEHRGTEEKS